MNISNVKEIKTNNILNIQNGLKSENNLNATNKLNGASEVNAANKVNVANEVNNEFELEIDDEIISYLSSLVDVKNVRHKILKINNLINENLYNYITNGEEYEEEEESNNTYDNYTHTSDKKKNILFDNLSYETDESSADTNRKSHVCKNFNHVDNIKMSKLLNENINTCKKKKKNSLLFLRYDQQNDNCDICNKYRKNCVLNMNFLNSHSVNKFNDLNDYFFILGSTSNSRKYILKKCNLNFLSVHIKIDEKKIGCRKRHDPITLTSNISIAKGLKLLSMINNSTELKKKIVELSKNKKVILLVGDEIIFCNNKIYEKPKDKKEAYTFFKSYNNNDCCSYSSITLIDFKKEQIITGIDRSVIKICNMDDHIINKIMTDSSIYYCAGALKIENAFIHKYIKVIKGNIDSIFGLSVNLLLHLVNLL